jgi:hypothetical protein
MEKFIIFIGTTQDGNINRNIQEQVQPNIDVINL